MMYENKNTFLIYLRDERLVEITNVEELKRATHKKLSAMHCFALLALLLIKYFQAK